MALWKACTDWTVLQDYFLNSLSGTSTFTDVWHPAPAAKRWLALISWSTGKPKQKNASLQRARAADTGYCKKSSISNGLSSVMNPFPFSFPNPVSSHVSLGTCHSFSLLKTSGTIRSISTRSSNTLQKVHWITEEKSNKKDDSVNHSNFVSFTEPVKVKKKENFILHLSKRHNWFLNSEEYLQVIK